MFAAVFLPEPGLDRQEQKLHWDEVVSDGWEILELQESLLPSFAGGCICGQVFFRRQKKIGRRKTQIWVNFRETKEQPGSYFKR